VQDSLRRLSSFETELLELRASLSKDVANLKKSRRRRSKHSSSGNPLLPIWFMSGKSYQDFQKKNFVVILSKISFKATCQLSFAWTHLAFVFAGLSKHIGHLQGSVSIPVRRRAQVLANSFGQIILLEKNQKGFFRT